MIEKLESDLKHYVTQIEELNRELGILEEKKREIIRVGTRLEGIVAYLKESIKDAKSKVENPIPK